MREEEKSCHTTCIKVCEMIQTTQTQGVYICVARTRNDCIVHCVRVYAWKQKLYDWQNEMREKRNKQVLITFSSFVPCALCVCSILCVVVFYCTAALGDVMQMSKMTDYAPYND